MSKLTITLDGEALLALQEVLLDGDPELALDYLQRYIAPCLPRRGAAPCDSTRLNPYMLKTSKPVK